MGCEGMRTAAPKSLPLASSIFAVTDHSPALTPRTRAVIAIGPLPGRTSSIVSSTVK
jgi:hypothetical protein